MYKYSKLIKQVLFFGIVGGVSLLIDLLVTSMLYNLFNFAPYLAGSIGFLSAFFFNFPINRKHVFKHSEKDRFSLKAQVTFYASLSTFNLLATAILMQLFVQSEIFTVEIAKILVTGLIAVWNFILFKKLIFSSKPNVDIERLSIQ